MIRENNAVARCVGSRGKSRARGGRGREGRGERGRAQGQEGPLSPSCVPINISSAHPIERHTPTIPTTMSDPLAFGAPAAEEVGFCSRLSRHHSSFAPRAPALALIRPKQHTRNNRTWWTSTWAPLLRTRSASDATQHQQHQHQQQHRSASPRSRRRRQRQHQQRPSPSRPRSSRHLRPGTRSRRARRHQWRQQQHQ